MKRKGYARGSERGEEGREIEIARRGGLGDRVVALWTGRIRMSPGAWARGRRGGLWAGRGRRRDLKGGAAVRIVLDWGWVSGWGEEGREGERGITWRAAFADELDERSALLLFDGLAEDAGWIHGHD